MSSTKIIMLPSSEDIHPSDDALELYSLGRLAESAAGVLEEHLLGCEQCQRRTRESDEYVAAMRRALVEVQAESARKARQGLLARILSLPKPVWVGAVTAALILAVVLPSRRTAEPPYRMQLTAYRGEAALRPKPAPAGRKILLEVDVTGLPESHAYLLEVVDSTGGVLRRENRSPASATLTIQLDPLAAGRYWIRIYQPAGAGSAPGELLREVALLVQ